MKHGSSRQIKTWETAGDGQTAAVKLQDFLSADSRFDWTSISFLLIRVSSVFHPWLNLNCSVGPVFHPWLNLNCSAGPVFHPSLNFNRSAAPVLKTALRGLGSIQVNIVRLFPSGSCSRTSR